MAVNLTKNSIELGIITLNPDDMLKFYRDTLGFALEATLDMPSGDTMYRLKCGDCIIKVVNPKNQPAAQAAPGGIPGATGYRYWTIYISDLSDAVEEIRSAGYTVVLPATDLFPGVQIAIVEDPDRNWVEFVCREDL